MRMKKSRSLAPKSPFGRILAADGASIPILRRGGISAHVRLDKDDSKRHVMKSGFAGAVSFSPHIFFKIPLTATQRDIRAAVKELLKELSGLRGQYDHGRLRAALAQFDEGRGSLAGITDPRQRRRNLDGTLARVADILEGGPGKTVGELRGESRAPFASRTGAAALRRKRDRWIKRRDEELKREGLAEYDRYARIKEELLARKDGKKHSFGRWSWDKQDPYALTEDTIRKIITHNR